jgi:prepilin-type processing-associated H-X9-DG protein
VTGVRYRILQCPGEKGAWLLDFAAHPIKMFDHPVLPSSYALNVAIPGAGWPYPGSPRAMFGQYTGNDTGQPGSYVGNISEVGFIMDCPNWGASNSDIPSYSWYIDHAYNPDFYYGSYAFRHPGNRANMLYYDGHVGSVRHYAETGKPIWNWKYP